MQKKKKKKKKNLWNFAAPEIKHLTTRMGYRNVNVFFKIISLQCSWLWQLFENSFHQWKVIPLFFISKTFG